MINLDEISVICLTYRKYIRERAKEIGTPANLKAIWATVLDSPYITAQKNQPLVLLATGNRNEFLSQISSISPDGSNAICEIASWAMFSDLLEEVSSIWQTSEEDAA